MDVEGFERRKVTLWMEGREDALYEPRSIAYHLNPKTGVAVATLNTPDRLNTLSPNMFAEMFVVLDHMRRDPQVKVAVWTAVGRAFTAGAQLKGDRTVHVPPEYTKAYLARGMFPRPGDLAMKALTLAFWDFPKPSVVAVNGLAVGGGANICLANFHDIVVVSTAAKFKWPFAKLGIVPELGSSLYLPTAIGMARTKELMMLGDWVSAEQTVALGLANRVVPPDELMPTALDLATRLAAWPAQNSLRLNKRLLNFHLRERLEAATDKENEYIREALSSFKASPFLTGKL